MTDIQSKILGMSAAARETLRCLFFHGPTWDGDVPSKSGRDELVELKLADRMDGWQWLTRRRRLFPHRHAARRGKGKMAAEAIPMKTLQPCAERLLANFPSNYRDLAAAAVENGKAFCPSCHFAGMMNCGHFDECRAFIEPTDAHRADAGPLN